MKTFTQRAEAIIKGLSPMVKTVLPGALITLLVDMCKALDQLQEKNK
jgi:hypothetical protein